MHLLSELSVPGCGIHRRFPGVTARAAPVVATRNPAPARGPAGFRVRGVWAGQCRETALPEAGLRGVSARTPGRLRARPPVSPVSRRRGRFAGTLRYLLRARRTPARAQSQSVDLARLARALPGPGFTGNPGLSQETLAALFVLLLRAVAALHAARRRPGLRAPTRLGHRAVPRSGPGHRPLRRRPLGPAAVLRFRLQRWVAARRLRPERPGLGLPAALLRRASRKRIPPVHRIHPQELPSRRRPAYRSRDALLPPFLDSRGYRRHRRRLCPRELRRPDSHPGARKRAPAGGRHRRGPGDSRAVRARNPGPLRHPELPPVLFRKARGWQVQNLRR